MLSKGEHDRTDDVCRHWTGKHVKVERDMYSTLSKETITKVDIFVLAVSLQAISAIFWRVKVKVKEEKFV